MVSIWTSDFSGPPYGASSYPDYELFREQTDVMAGVAAFGLEPVNLVEADETVRLAPKDVSANYFEVLGVPLRKVECCVRETASTRAPVVVISHALWQSRFGADARVVGSTVRLNAGVFTVVGVAPEGFHGSERVDRTPTHGCRSRPPRSSPAMPAF